MPRSGKKMKKKASSSTRRQSRKKTKRETKRKTNGSVRRRGRTSHLPLAVRRREGRYGAADRGAYRPSFPSYRCTEAETVRTRRFNERAIKYNTILKETSRFHDIPELQILPLEVMETIDTTLCLYDENLEAVRPAGADFHRSTVQEKLDNMSSELSYLKLLYDTATKLDETPPHPMIAQVHQAAHLSTTDPDILGHFAEATRYATEAVGRYNTIVDDFLRATNNQ